MMRRTFLAGLASLFAADRVAEAASARARQGVEALRRRVAEAPHERAVRGAAPGRHRARRLEPFNGEKRKGTFVCAGCDLPLFKSETKYESGTGWPSFFDFPSRAQVEPRQVEADRVPRRIERRCGRDVAAARASAATSSTRSGSSCDATNGWSPIGPARPRGTRRSALEEIGGWRVRVRAHLDARAPRCCARRGPHPAVVLLGLRVKVPPSPRIASRFTG